MPCWTVPGPPLLSLYRPQHRLPSTSLLVDLGGCWSPSITSIFPAAKRRGEGAGAFPLEASQKSHSTFSHRFN